MENGMAAAVAPTRRERQRQATYDEIVAVARTLLRAGEDVSLRAVAGEMGLTAPALYRYVDSHAELMQLVARSVFKDVVAAMTVARDRHADEDPSAQIVASASAFRTWALGNRPEFQLVFASAPAPGMEDLAAPSAHVPITSLNSCVPAETGVDQFAGFFGEIFGRLWAKYQFPLPADDELDPDVLDALRSQIEPDPATKGLDAVTPGMIWLFERSWALLYGTVTLEVFGHVHPAFTSSGALFGAAMLDIGRTLGIADEWPRLQQVARAPS
jgi:AcrR family transcriptional regulator